MSLDQHPTLQFKNNIVLLSQVADCSFLLYPTIIWSASSSKHALAASADCPLVDATPTPKSLIWIFHSPSIINAKTEILAKN